DVGCANGFLVECLVAWDRERGISLTPYGVDQGSRLIARARKRLPHYADHFFVGNGWDWEPPQPFRYVYTLYDVVPLDYLAVYIQRLLDRVVAPGGRLIVGAYGSRSRQLAPFNIMAFLQTHGYVVADTSSGGTAIISQFAWIDNRPRT